MKETVNKKLLLGTTYTRQYDSLVHELYAARYAYEMGALRPGQNESEIQRDQAKKKEAMSFAEWQLLSCEKMIQNVTGLTVEELRTTADDLTEVVKRVVEVEAQISKCKLLNPALLTTLKNRIAGVDDQFQPSAFTEERQAISELEKAQADLPQLEAHLAELAKVADMLAEKIQFKAVSDIVQVGAPLITLR